MKPLRPLLASAAAVLSLGLTACSNSESTTTATSTSPADSPRATTDSAPGDPRSEAALALSSTVQISDLGADWTERATQAIPDAQLNSTSGCSTLDLPAPGLRSAGAAAQFSYRLEAGAEEAQLQSIALVQASAADTEQTRRRLGDPQYASCLEQDAVTFIERAAGAPVQEVTTTPLRLARPLDGVALRVVVHYSFSGANKVGYIDYFDHLIGRVESRIRLSRCCVPFDDSMEHALLQTTTARITRSPINE